MLYEWNVFCHRQLNQIENHVFFNDLEMRIYTNNNVTQTNINTMIFNICMWFCPFRSPWRHRSFCLLQQAEQLQQKRGRNRKTEVMSTEIITDLNRLRRSDRPGSLLLVLTSSVVSVYEYQQDGGQQVWSRHDDVAYESEDGHHLSCRSINYWQGREFNIIVQIYNIFIFVVILNVCRYRVSLCGPILSLCSHFLSFDSCLMSLCSHDMAFCSCLKCL